MAHLETDIVERSNKNDFGIELLLLATTVEY